MISEDFQSQRADHFTNIIVSNQIIMNNKTLIIFFKSCNNMQQQCLGCRKSFEQNQKINANQNLLIQFKNYYLPINDEPTKLILLKQIVSFLNSKGGTIYIGIEDKQGRVKGVELGHKDMDQFQLWMKPLIKRIYPIIDLGDRQEIIVHFVPVKKDGKFRGRYVVKIIVKQGNTSRIFCINQRAKTNIQIGGTNDGTVHFAYLRQTLGATKRIYGNDLLELIYQRSREPVAPYKPHEGCNPEPTLGKFEVQNICFQNVDANLSNNLKLQLEIVFPKLLKSIDMDYNTEKAKLIVRCSQLDRQQFKQISDFLTINSKKLNQLCNCNLRVKGQQKSRFIIENLNNQSNNKPQPPQAKPKYLPKQNEKSKEKPKESEKSKGKDHEKDKDAKKSEEAKQSLIFINVKQPQNLQKILTDIFSKKKVDIVDHQCSILETIFSDKNDLKDSYKDLKAGQQNIKRFFFKQQPVYGQSDGKLAITFFEKSKSAQLIKYLKQDFKKQYVDITPGKFNGKDCIQFQLIQPNQICKTFERLYRDKEIHSRFKSKEGKGFLRININLKTKN